MAARILLGWLSLLLAFDKINAAPTSSNPMISWKSAFNEKTTKTPSGFSVRQVKIPNSTPQLVNATDLYLNTLHKYNRPIPDSLSRRNVPKSSTLEGRETTFKMATWFTDGFYTVPIQIGTPPQTCYVMFDTGSYDLWVFSSGMPTSESSGHIIYSPAQSSTSQLMAGQNFSDNYGDGLVSGDVYTDVLGVGPISISGYPIETALNVSSSLAVAYNLSGIWGMDMSYYEGQSPLAIPTWLTFADYGLGITLFTINFVYYGAGTVTFGTIDSTQYTGSISYSPVLSNYEGQSWWVVNVTGYSVGSVTSQTASIGGAILDTGSILTYLPEAVVLAYWEQVPGAAYEAGGSGNIVFPCNTALPDLRLSLLGGVTVTLHGRYLNPYGFQSFESGTYCLGGLQANTAGGVNLLGQAVFQSMFLVMDLGNIRVGFATKTLLD